MKMILGAIRILHIDWFWNGIAGTNAQFYISFEI